MKNKWYFFTFLGVVLFVLLCYFIITKSGSNTETSGTNKKIHVVTSFYPLYFFASLIGGDKVDVTNITPAGAEPHDYEPTAQDIARIEKSQLLILNGGKLEAWGDKIKDEMKGKQVAIITAGNAIANQHVEEDGETIRDPHVWLSPPLAKKEIEVILQGFIEIDTKNKEYYQSNADQLLAKLDDLDKKYKEGLHSCKLKDIITSHAAFGYIATTYHLHQLPISGLSPDEEPSSKQLADVSQFAKAHNVKYIFFESLVSPKLSETIATEVGAKTLVLDPIEGVSDEAAKQGKNYLTIMQDNLTNLRIALSCQ